MVDYFTGNVTGKFSKKFIRITRGGVGFVLGETGETSLERCLCNVAIEKKDITGTVPDWCLNENGIVILKCIYEDIEKTKMKRCPGLDLYYSSVTAMKYALSNISGMLPSVPDPKDKTKVWYHFFAGSRTQKTGGVVRKISGIDENTTFLLPSKEYSFGIEIETHSGYIFPSCWSPFLDVKCVRDGSINGKEYLTLPLTGDEGLLALQDILYTISKQCGVYYDCGLHVHIGKKHFNKEFLLAFYSLCCHLEQEIFSMMPPSRRVNDICRRLDSSFAFNINYKDKPTSSLNVRTAYDALFKAYHGTQTTGKETNKREHHERGNKCGYDKTTMRYCWLNLQHAIMNCKDDILYNKPVNTVEFRIHEGTLNFTTAMNWIIICMCIVKYVENNATRILSFHTVPTLKEIIRLTFKYHEYVNDYIEERKRMFPPGNKELADINERQVYYRKNSNTIKKSTLVQLIKTMKHHGSHNL